MSSRPSWQGSLAARRELSRKYEGTGLGLPISKAFAELHGGSFRMNSKLGVGTTVIIQFPAERVEHSSHNSQNLDTAHEMVG